MGITLFWYVFKNLLKVFLAASGVIAGIMSFGGLLKRLTDNGLDVAQVGKMLTFAMPAMTTYSYPIAALFACTVVYGRLAADNEVTAFRAAGISMGPWGLGRPALVLGLIVSIASLAALSYLVPAASLGMERTVISNIGQMVVNRITQQHQIQLLQAGSQPLTIYARAAQLEPADPARPNEQVVTLEGVSIVTFDKTDAENQLAIPAEFYLAKTARAYIRQSDDPDDDAKPVQLLAVLSDGLKFPRSVTGRKESALQGGIVSTQFGPFFLQSPLRENTKFMDVRKLQDLSQHPEKSRRMKTALQNLITTDQQTAYLQTLVDQLKNTGIVQFATPAGDGYTLVSSAATNVLERARLTLTGDEANQVRLIQKRSGDQPSDDWFARVARIKVFPDNDDNRLAVAVELLDAELKQDGESSIHDGKEINFAVAMPPDVRAIADRTVKDFDRPELAPLSRQILNRNLMKQNNSVRSEMHSRISFAISCAILTLVGYGLGVMFKSGNYLNAFAISVVPAILSIVLVVTGQHICENVPPDMRPGFKDPLGLGLTVIWTGNVAVLALATGLLLKLRRT